MKVEVIMTRREGRALRKRELQEIAPVYGSLQFAYHGHKGRFTWPVISLTSITSTSNDRPQYELLYPVLENLGHEMIVFRGYETVMDRDQPRSYMQEWRCRVLTSEEVFTLANRDASRESSAY